MHCPATCTAEPLQVKSTVRAAIFDEPWKTAAGLKAGRTAEFFYYIVEYNKGHCTFKATEPFHIPASSEIFTDGSCRAQNTPDAMAAGAATYLVEGSPETGTYKAAAWAVPAELPQSSFTGEAMGLMVALKCLSIEERNQPGTHRSPSSRTPQQ